MFELIDTLRRKPEGTQRRIAFLVAFIVILCVFLIWLSVIYPNIEQVSSRKEAVKRKDPSPFSVLSTQISSVFSSTEQSSTSPR